MYSWFVLHQVLEPFRVDSPVDNYGEENRLRETWVEAWPATGKPKPSPRGSPESARPRRCSSRHCPAPRPARREAPSAPPPPRSPIGRASCRERVCKYVWISVGAVSLKKKKKKTKTE